MSLQIILFSSLILQDASNSLFILGTFKFILNIISFEYSISASFTLIIKIKLFDIMYLSKIFSAFNVIVCLSLNPFKFNSLGQLVAFFFPSTLFDIFISYPINSSLSKLQYFSFNSK